MLSIRALPLDSRFLISERLDLEDPAHHELALRRATEFAAAWRAWHAGYATQEAHTWGMFTTKDFAN